MAVVDAVLWKDAPPVEFSGLETYLCVTSRTCVFLLVVSIYFVVSDHRAFPSLG